MSALLEKSLAEKRRDERWQQWRPVNRTVIRAMNNHLRKHGVLSDKCRTW